MIIEIDGIPIEIIRKPIKSLNLRIYPPAGIVKFSVPIRYSEQLIRQHLQSKSSWIKSHRDRVLQRAPQSDAELITGASVPFEGKNYLLIVEEQHGPSQIKVNGELMHLYIAPQATQDQKKALLERWYRQEMERVLPELIARWEKVVGVRVMAWGLRSMKTRWGSCNTRVGRIWLSLNLAKKPLICLEYVLVHELVHLLEASHNQRFYRLMSQFMPDWREYEYLLEGKRTKK